MNRVTLIATAVFAVGAASAAIDDPVRLDTGLVSGAATSSEVRAFKGIPFAVAPVGDLRWREPRRSPAKLLTLGRYFFGSVNTMYEFIGAAASFGFRGA